MDVDHMRNDSQVVRNKFFLKGAVLIPGLLEGTMSLRDDHGGEIRILLVLYAIQIYIRPKYMIQTKT